MKNIWQPCLGEQQKVLIKLVFATTRRLRALLLLGGDTLVK